jgi:flagellar hook assembly protein FlgD
VVEGYHHYSWNGKNAEGNTLPVGVYMMVISTGEGMFGSYKLIKIR